MRPDRRREEASFDSFFDAAFPNAVGVARRLLGDPGTAEDIALEAMARAHLNWSRVEHMPWRDAWLLRVTINLALDHARAARRREHVTGTLFRRAADVAAPDPADEVVLRNALTAALTRLPDRQRTAVGLRYLAGLSESEVASLLGLSPETVKTHVTRGLGGLRKSLAPRSPQEVFDAGFG